MEEERRGIAACVDVVGHRQSADRALRPVSHSWFERFRTIFRVTAIVC